MLGFCLLERMLGAFRSACAELFNKASLPGHKKASIVVLIVADTVATKDRLIDRG